MTLDVSFDMLYPIRPNPLLDFRKPWPDHSRFSKEQTNKQTYYTDSTPLSHDGHDQLGWPPPKLTKEDKQSWSLSYGSNNLWNLVMMPNLTLGQKFQAHRMLDPWVHHTILHVYHHTTDVQRYVQWYRWTTSWETIQKICHTWQALAQDIQIKFTIAVHPFLQYIQVQPEWYVEKDLCPGFQVPIQIPMYWLGQLLVDQTEMTSLMIRGEIHHVQSQPPTSTLEW